MNMKSVVGVIFVAILIGVIYVVFEKHFLGEASISSSPSSSSNQKAFTPAMQVEEESSLIEYPTDKQNEVEVTGSTDLLQAAEGLTMRDYSGMFEDLKDTVSQQ